MIICHDRDIIARYAEEIFPVWCNGLVCEARDNGGRQLWCGEVSDIIGELLARLKGVILEHKA